MTEDFSVVMTRARYERDVAALLTTARVIALAASDALSSGETGPGDELTSVPISISVEVAGSDAVRAAIDAAYPRIT